MESIYWCLSINIEISDIWYGQWWTWIGTLMVDRSQVKFWMTVCALIHRNNFKKRTIIRIIIKKNKTSTSNRNLCHVIEYIYVTTEECIAVSNLKINVPPFKDDSEECNIYSAKCYSIVFLCVSISSTFLFIALLW